MDVGPPAGITQFTQFRARFGSQVPSTPGLSYAPTQFETGEEKLQMLVPRTPAATSSIIHTSVIECNDPINTPHQTAAFYLSVLSGLFPGLLPLSKQVLQEMGYSVTEVTEDTAANYSITLQSCINCSTLFAIFGQLALIIYKNIDDRSYVRFMQSRASAIKSEAGVARDLVPGKGDVLLSITAARNIRTIVGGSSKFRAALLNIILANRNGLSMLNNVCNYVAEIINWTEMGPFMFVYESLCLTNSPVLKDSRVRHEGMHLLEAVKRVSEAPFPQYYRVLYPTEAAVTIVRSRFETLAEVARQYRSELYSTVGQFAAPANLRDNALVNDLLSIHRAHMSRNIVDDDMARVIRLLTNFDNED